LIEKNWELGKEVLMAFIVYNKACDSVKKEETWKSLEKIKMSADLLRKVKNV
jgi:hypothetical protein